MSFHRLVIVKEKTPDNYKDIMHALSGLHQQMILSANYSTTSDRIKNIDTTTGLIQRYFVKKDPPMLGHGPGLAIDLENSLRRSRLETSRYECKQGFVNLSPQRKFDKNLPKKIIETICGISNVGPDADGFIFIGVADTKADSERVEQLDDITPTQVGNRYVVGLDRERKILGYNEEQYLEKIMGYIRTSELSEPLKSQVLSQIDYVEYKGHSVLRLRIPAQSELSFVGEDVFIREASSTVAANTKKILAASKLFS